MFLRHKMLLRNITAQITAVVGGSWKAGRQPFPQACLPVARLLSLGQRGEVPAPAARADPAPQPPGRADREGFSEDLKKGKAVKVNIN